MLVWLQDRIAELERLQLAVLCIEFSCTLSALRVSELVFDDPNASTRCSAQRRDLFQDGPKQDSVLRSHFLFKVRNHGRCQGLSIPCTEEFNQLNSP